MANVAATTSTVAAAAFVALLQCAFVVVALYSATGKLTH